MKGCASVDLARRSWSPPDSLLEGDSGAEGCKATTALQSPGSEWQWGSVHPGRTISLPPPVTGTVTGTDTGTVTGTVTGALARTRTATTRPFIPRGLGVRAADDRAAG